MLHNYLKIAFRNLIKNKVYSVVNILGLAIGLACCIIIFLFIRDEMRYDQYHEKADRIYRVERYGHFNGKEYRYPNQSALMGSAFVDEYPEVLQYVRFRPYELQIRNSQRDFGQERLIATDHNVFDVFSFELLHGKPESALANPYSVVLTEEMAQRYLAPGNPIGQTLTVLWGQQTYDFQVTGILKKMPAQSHFHGQILFSFSTLPTLSSEEYYDWISMTMHTYLLLDEGADPGELEQKFPDYLEKYLSPVVEEIFGTDTNLKDSNLMNLELRPLTDIYLYSDLDQEIDPMGDVKLLFILTAVALLILVVACINFINLTTARALNRGKEIGVRKTMGATRVALFVQLVGEAVLFAIAALGVGVLFVELMLPAFNAFTHKELSLLSGNLSLLPFLLVFAVLIGITAGTYPAMYLSSFHLSDMLKKAQRSGTGGLAIHLRKVLVILQFTISICLVISTLIVSGQMRYILNKDMGFDKTNLLDVNIDDNLLRQNVEPIRTELLRHPDILDVSVTSAYLGQSDYNYPGMTREGDGVDEIMPVYKLVVDEHFIPTLGMEIVAGRNFSSSYGKDSNAESLIINETAVKRFGWESPEAALGQNLLELNKDSEDRVRYEIVGVVRNFNFTSMRRSIEPMAFKTNEWNQRYLYVRMAGNNVAGTLAVIEQTLKKFSPGFVFDYSFQNAHFAELHKKEQKLQQLSLICAGLAIFIAGVGLFALSAYLIELRTKEVGIRKILGATSSMIWRTLSAEYIKMVIIANIFAWPLAWYAMNRWLQDFVYRIDLTLWPFLWAGLVVLAIALLTVSGQALRVAVANPVESLRSE